MDIFKRSSLTIILIVISSLTLIINSCSYDDTSIREELNELKLLVEKLDAWCEDANSQITALQSLVHALEQNDYITNVAPIMKGSTEVGYTISFRDRNPIHIYNGEDGKDGLVPIIGVKAGDDGRLYWTVHIGTAPAEFMLDAAGQKIPVTGADGTHGSDGTDGTDGAPGVSPTINVAAYDGTKASFKGKLCWKVNGIFLLSGGNPVLASGVDGSPGATGATGEAGATGPTGPAGDAIFKENGIKIDQTNGTVTFTLANGTSTITLPLVSELTVSILGGNGIKEISQSTQLFTINGTGSITAMKAEITSGAGVVTDATIARSSTSSAPWGVTIGAKVDGTDNTWSSVVTVNRYVIPASEYINSNEAILKITVIDEKGNEVSTSCPLKVLSVTIAAGESLESAMNALAPLAIADIEFLKINGLISDSDFINYLKPLFKGSLLDLSDASVDENIFPYDVFTGNTTLESILFPKNISIGSSAFSGCTSLSSVEMSSVTSLEYSTFSGCTSLTEINLPIATAIGHNAFSDCTSLSLINIPKVTVIGVDAFYDTLFTEISFYDLKDTSGLDVDSFLGSNIKTIKVYNSTSAFIQTFNAWLDTNFPAATAI